MEMVSNVIDTNVAETELFIVLQLCDSKLS